MIISIVHSNSHIIKRITNILDYHLHHPYTISNTLIPAEMNITDTLEDIPRIRNINKKKHNLMKEFLKKFLGDDVKILREGSGLNLLIKPLIDIDLEKLEEIAQQKNVKIYFKEFFNLEKVIALGFGGFEEFEIENAIKIFSEIWLEAKKK